MRRLRTDILVLGSGGAGLLAALHARHGGSLLRIELAEVAPLGRLRGWQPSRPVVQWAVTR